MARWIVGTLKWLLALLVLVLIFAWLVLAAPFFSELRRTTVETVLSEQIGQPLHVREDVSVVVGPVSRVNVAGVEIPSENIPDTALAELNVLELDLDLIALFSGQIDLDNLTVDGLQVNMLTQADGTTSWTPSEEPEELPEDDEADDGVDEPVTEQGEDSDGILGFLRHRTASFTSVGLTIDNQVSGFTFVFDLENLNLDQLDDGARLGVTSQGTVNGETFQIEGSYPTAAPFTTHAGFGDMELSFDGDPVPQDQGGGYVGLLTLDTGSFGDLLDVLGLERVLEGSGNLSAKLTGRSNALQVSDLGIVVDLEEGQQFTAQGTIENIVAAEGFDVAFGARFHPEGDPPEPARELKDVKLTSMTFEVVSEGQALEIDDFLMSTNAFDQGLDQVGPVTIGRIHRTPEGQLALADVSLQAGPMDSPYVVAKGDVMNLLELEQLNLEGTFSAPASLILASLGEDVAEAFGGIEAEFAIDDAQGHLGLTRLDATTVNTSIWSLKAHAEMGDVTQLDGLDFDFDLDIADGATFLGALKLEEIDTGPLEVNASANRNGKELKTSLGLGAGISRLDASLDTAVTDGRPRIVGRVFSERLDIDDLRDAVAGVVQLSKIGESDSPDGGTAEETAGDPEVQPLVLPDKNADEDVAEAGADAADPDVQPLVLPKEAATPTDLVDLEKLFLETDLTVSIDIQEISGQQGVSSLSSELLAKDGKAQLGPVEVTYGGGYFKVEAAMDLIETPELISVSGATSGWDFGKILDAVGLGIDAHGKLSGNFDLTGNRASVNTFINSMYGSASISMSQGDIATSLLELAGLGIFPWLFSEELQQGYTDIVCVVAPVRINSGKVTFDSVVAETASVQLVARGAVDWRRDSIAVRAEPRRVGKPLARSAWPFEVVGQLSAPKFKLDVGGSRTQRTDGADEMPANRRPCVPDIRQLE